MCDPGPAIVKNADTILHPMEVNGRPLYQIQRLDGLNNEME